MVWLNDFSAEILLQELPLDGGFAWPTIYFNIIWKEMLFTRCAILQWNTHQAFIALWFLSFYLLLFFCAACISSLDEQAFNTVREFWLLLMVDCSCGLCVSRVPVYNTVQPQSGTIVFFSHFYIWSNWIDKVRECDNLTCSVFTPHSALILD